MSFQNEQLFTDVMHLLALRNTTTAQAVHVALAVAAAYVGRSTGLIDYLPTKTEHDAVASLCEAIISHPKVTVGALSRLAQHLPEHLSNVALLQTVQDLVQGRPQDLTGEEK